MRPAWIEVDSGSLRSNVRQIKEMVSGCAEVMGVIKADGYGHGAVRMAEILREEGITRFAVALPQEGIGLRNNGIEEAILILGYTDPDDCEEPVAYNLAFTVFSSVTAKALSRAAVTMGKRVTVHIKVDTGMGRVGFKPDEESVREILYISELPGIYVEGIYSHLANAGESNDTFSKKQFNLFKEFYQELECAGLRIPVRHLANSAALLKFPEMHLDMVRMGICMYGLNPGPGAADGSWDFLKPVMQVKSRLVHIKKVPPDTPISYGCTFKAVRDSIIGTVPMGYADGISRSLSNRGYVLVRGQRCLISGRICMDQFMVDLTGLPEVHAGDEVVIIGSQENERITVEEIASITGTISYEVVSRMSKRLPIIYK